MGVIKSFNDNSEKDKRTEQIMQLEKSLSISGNKLDELSNQLNDTEAKLQNSMEESAKLQVKYLRLKDADNINKWLTAFKAEKELNDNLLNFLAHKLDSGSRVKFLYEPSFVKVNYLTNMLNKPHTAKLVQLKHLTMLLDELNEINERIKAGRDALGIGRQADPFAGISRFMGIERNAANAIRLYQAILDSLNSKL